MKTPYQKLRDIVVTANAPTVVKYNSVNIDLDLLNSVCVMVEELKDSVERIQRLRPTRSSSMQAGVESYLTSNAIEYADLVSDKYWPDE